ncbi:hypothetical protein AB0E25_39125 [Streptomyces bobili]|uniref:hypothetical protein n=1 Tax=Streptomyces bobili TaxID=67280 RepID=UPI0033E5EA19
MRRRVRLSRLVLFTAIAAGPAALGVAVMSGPTTVAATPSDKPAAVRSAATAADPAGYAQVFVESWLRSSTDDANSAQARLAQSLAPDVDPPDPVASAQPKPASVTAVRSAQQGDGEWAVTAAAQYADGRLRYFVVRECRRERRLVRRDRRPRRGGRSGARHGGHVAVQGEHSVRR